MKQICIGFLSLWIIACGGLVDPSATPTSIEEVEEEVEEADNKQPNTVNKAQGKKLPANITGGKATPKPPKSAVKATPKASPKPAPKPAPKPPPEPEPPSCWDLRNDCDWDRHCSSIGDARERSTCIEGCEAWAETQGCE